MRAGRTTEARPGSAPTHHEVVHLYAQGHPHDEAYLLADEAGLRAIQGAIARALDAPDGIRSVTAFTADGEEYDLVVIRSGPEALGVAELPYTEADALDPRPEAVHPAAIYWGLRRPRPDADPPERA